MKKTKVLLSLLAALVLTGCEFSFTSGSMGSAGEGSTSGSIDSGVTSSDPTSSGETSTSGSTSSGGTSTSTSTSEGVQPVNSAGGDSSVVRIREVNEQLGWSTLESIGNQKMLVVPVQLSGETAWSSRMLTDIENAFFGASSDTSWESVSSFYYKSSYGQLNITGEVTTPYVSSYTYDNLYNYGDNSSNQLISQWTRSNGLSNSKLQEYDQDKDGLIDCTVFIYSNPYSPDGEGFWAWCSAVGGTPNTDKPVVNNYMWASYTFLEETYRDGFNSNKIDAHTYIHETGHLIGLDDYYCYDTSGTWHAAGQLEMQSFNVGDQNIYSKYALGWITPTQAKTTTSVTYNLGTSASSPQAILINDNWNGTPFDEYLMLEFYTPTGLNETDANHPYDTRDTMYNYSGIRLYHVDARLAELDWDTEAFISYVDSIGNEPDSFYFVGAANSVGRSYLNSPYNRVYRYVHLLDQGGRNRLNDGSGGTVNASTALWTAGHTFTPSSTFFYEGSGTSFNNRNRIGYSIRVDSISGTNAQVTITKI